MDRKFLIGKYDEVIYEVNMKVLCKDSLSGYYLTIGKWYNVVEEDTTHYKVIDDEGDLSWWRKDYFKTQAEVREDKLRELGI